MQSCHPIPRILSSFEYIDPIFINLVVLTFERVKKLRVQLIKAKWLSGQKKHVVVMFVSRLLV